MIDIILWIITSLPALALSGGTGLLGVVGAMLGLFPKPWGFVAKLGGLALLALFFFIFGFRAADERQAIASLRNELSVTKADLQAEKDARRADQRAIQELAAEKEKAERSHNALQDYIRTLPTADQCIATPERIKQLHKHR